MRAGKAIDTALKTLGLPVSRAFRKVNAQTAPRAYITYQLIIGLGAEYADDEELMTETTWRIDLFSKDNYTALLPEIVRALKAADFYGVLTEAEQYEQDTGYYHISFEAKFLTEVE
jgi:hypothetical protein